jgi:hypothetical protein
LHARHPGPIAALTGPSLATRLLGRPRRARPPAPRAASERAALLDYFAAPRWLDRYGAAELAALRELPLLRTLAGRQSSCAGAPGVFLPGGFRPPALLEVALRAGGHRPGRPLAALPRPARRSRRWAARHYLAAVLIPAYAGLAPELQRAALLWLRDEVELTAVSSRSTRRSPRCCGARR